VHLTRDGYERLGNALLNDLLAEFERYETWTRRLDKSDSATNRPR
jgi:hypothetical protein